MKKATAVIVTYNRKDLLCECIEAVLSQKPFVPDIIVVDNASTDGTKEALGKYPQIQYFNTGSNLGGAGGFNYGIRKGTELGYKYLWLMDDDCIPTAAALAKLKEAASKYPNFGFLSSKVLWRDGSVCIMNVQREKLTKNVTDFSAGQIRPVVMASFVSLLVRTDVVKKLGLPIMEFFLWTDDWEWTRRISRKYPCYLVTDSVVTHKSKANIGADISSETADRLDRFNYLYRNDVVLYRREGLKGYCYECVRLTGHCVRVVLKAKDHKLERIQKIIGGTVSGLRFYPEIEYVANMASSDKARGENIRILEAFGEPIADGGQEAFVFGVMEKMDMTGMTIDCLTAYDCRSEHYKSLVENFGGKVYALNLPFTPGKSRLNIRKPFGEFLKEHHYDIVHIHSGSISVLAIMSAVADKAGAKKVIVHSHASGDNDNLKHKVLRWTGSIMMGPHADVYCACSKEAAEWKFEPKFAGNAHIIMNGIDTKRFTFNPEKRAFMRHSNGLDGKFVIGHVGRFTKEKNHEFLINVFKKIVLIEPAARLLLVGTGTEIDKIKAKVRNEALDDYVTFTGSVTNVEDYLQAMDVFVLPSHFEGLGIVAIEAQCCGLPVIASDKVPKTAAVTDRMTFLSLQNDINEWKKSILSYRVDERTGSTKNLEFIDIENTCEQVRKLYVI